ncbi:MAG: TonB-dependent receptor [Desulfobacterota bacterium]|nr:TonB-dependent receptor [Thermodesulfobacteriota bacterium]
MIRFFYLLATTILLLADPNSLRAQEKEITLETIVVTATRDPQEVRKIPANITVITREQIERSNAQSTVDLLRTEAGVVVRDYTGSGKTVSVDVRGFGETGLLNTLVLVDGRRVNEIDLSGVDWTQIPLDQIERIEILRGPGSVLYGDNAVGGVIHIITKKPEKPFSVKGEVVRGSYLYHKESASVSGKSGPLSALIHGVYSSTEGYRENNFFRYKDIGGKIQLDLNPTLQISLNGNFHRDDYGMPGALPRFLYKVDRRTTLNPDDKADTDDGYLSLGTKMDFKEMGRVETDLSYRHREVHSLFRSFFFEDRKNLSTFGLTPKYVLEKTIGGRANKLILGLDYYHSDSKVDSESLFFGPDRISVEKKSIGLYLYDEFSILEKLFLSLGGRWEWVTYDVAQASSGAEDRKRESEPAWNIGLNYLFGKGSSVFLSLKRSFRFPVSDELIQYFPLFQANTAIKPQRGYHYETGIRHALNDWLEGTLTLFWADLRDELFFNPLTFSNENYPRTRRRGLEAGLKAKPLQGFHVWGNYGYVHPKLRGDGFSGSDIPAVPRHKGSLGTDLHFGEAFGNAFLKGLTFSGRANFVGSRHFISDWGNRAGRLDGYYTLDAKLSYEWRGLKAFVGVNNLTNQKYAEHGVLNVAGLPFYYPSPERNFFGGLSFNF